MARLLLSDEQSTVRGRPARAGSRLARLVLAEERAPDRRRGVVDLRRRGGRSPISTAGSSAATAPPTCSRSRSTTTTCRAGANPTTGGRGPGIADRAGRPADRARRRRGVPDGRAPARRRRTRAPLDDELALLVVHGVLHLLELRPRRRARGRSRCNAGTGAAGALPAARRAEGRSSMSGADWAILVGRRRALRPLDLPRAVGDRVHADEPHPGARARRGGQQARGAAGARCSSSPSRRSTSVLLLVLVVAAHRRDAHRCAARRHARARSASSSASCCRSSCSS